MRNRFPQLRQHFYLSITRKLLLTVGTLLALSYLTTFVFFHQELQRLAAHQASTLGKTLSEQAALVSASSLIAEDSVSLNYGLQQLTAHPQIQGALIEDNRQRTRAQAGQERGALYQSPIRVGEETLGTLKLYVEAEPVEQILTDAFHITSLVALLGGLLTLAGTWWLGRRLTAAQTPLPDTPGESETYLEERGPDDETWEEDDWEENDGEERDPKEPDAASETGHAAATEAVAPQTEQAHLQPPQPEHSRETAETDRVPLAPTGSAGPCHYLLYVDTRVQGDQQDGDPLRRALLATYLRQLQEVASLYRGTLDCDSGDGWQLLFEAGSDGEHEQLALCAAQLFNRLYRGFNQQQIQAFSPVLDLRMSLVRGSGDSAVLAQEAARLCQAVHSNALITHRALISAPLLKERLLAEAELQATDGDGIIVQRLAPDYQNLLDQQAEHLLRRLQQAP